MTRDPHTETIRAFARLIEPIPGLADLTRRRHRTRLFVGGGCFVWLIFGFVVLMAYVLIGMALLAYIGAVEAVRFVIALGWLALWGLHNIPHKPRSGVQHAPF